MDKEQNFEGVRGFSLGSFAVSWEQRKAVDIADYSKGNGYSKSDLTENGTPIILYGRLYTKYQFAIDEVDTFATPKDGSIYSQGNEVIIPASGETAEDIARASAVEKSGILLGGDLNILRPFNFINPLFLALTISNGEPQKELAKKAQGKSVVHIHNSDIQEVTVSFPTRAEQDRIVAVFRSLDNLITLHQRKYDKLTNVKKSMLEKMFPKNGSNVPEIRFKGFSDAWEQRKLREVLISLQNNTLSRADLSSEEGIAKNIHYGDILVKFGEVIDLKTESLPMIADETVIAKYKSSFLQNGDVIVADTAEDETVGKCTEIAGLSDEIVISGLHTIPYRPLQKYAPGYLGYYMNSASFHNQLLPLMQGIKVTSISKTALQNTDILYPKSATEQAAIGKYFRNLDNLITLHQRELEKLKNLKKACLEKMFV